MSAPATPTGFAVDNKAITSPTLAFEYINTATSGAVKLLWTNPDLTANYRVQYKLAADSTWIDGAITGLNGSSAKLFGLDAPASYDFRVRGENGDGNSTYATLTAVSTGTPAIVAGDIVVPDEPIGTTVTEDSVTITLTDTSANEGYWEYTISTWPGLDLLFFGKMPVLDRVFTVPSLEPATTYALQIDTRGYLEAGIEPVLSSDDLFATFTTDAAEVGGAPDGMSGPAEITGSIYASLAADFTLSPAPAGSATWSISGAPSGISIDGTGTLNVTGRVTGAPTQAGIFDAIVVATWEDAGAVVTARLATRFLIEGGAFLTWLNNDPANLDLQVDFNTRVLTSSKAVSDVLWLKAGDAFNPFVIFRDGARILAPAINALRVKLVLADSQWNAMHGAPPILDLRPSPPLVVFFDGNRAYSFSAVLSHPNLTLLFDALNDANASTSAAVNCLIELSWKQAGAWVSSKFLKVTLAQDAIRN